MDWLKRLTNKPKSENASTPSTATRYPDLFPDLPDYNPESADGVRVGESPVPGLTLKHVLDVHVKQIEHIEWSPNGQYLSSGGADNRLCLWSNSDFDLLNQIEIGHFGVHSLSWSPDSKSIATGEWKKINLWSVEHGKVEYLSTLEGHTDVIFSISWSANKQYIASGSQDGSVKVWDWASGKIAWQHDLNTFIDCVAWSPDGSQLAIGMRSGEIRVYQWDSGGILFTLGNPGKFGDEVNSLSWALSGNRLIAAYADNTVRLWDIEEHLLLNIWEGHTDSIQSVRISPNGLLVASKAWDDSIILWETNSGRQILNLHASYHGNPIQGVAFHPTQSLFASVGKKDQVIYIWELDYELFLQNGDSTASTKRYTTAKLVLVGDSGVGKTGLGWRLAHGEFKEHASTHGQQFWVIDELGQTRADGTECEAVLWDLAGQHIYRPIHAIFLDDVDASLVLFDPTNRQEPLKGAEFWLEQLARKKRLPPSVLVGARLDRGAAVLSQEELTQFCQQRGISGGYIGTSAKENINLDELLETLKQQIPWDQMTTTVTTRTFKRVKEYVLSLKEKPDRKGVLVSPAELRRQLETSEVLDISEVWTFTDAEMMTAVGHLGNHGYVAILRSSSGAEHILLVPELLVDLASSIVLQADKHPRELGALNESDLLAGRYPLPELNNLETDEAHILLDAAVTRFLEHNICFRETLGNDTLLIFPGLIKQKRPLRDDVEALDDISYIVLGRVENIYPALVVLLGFTRTFTRVNQWQRQAQYEMGAGDVCGFRLIEDVEGEIELILYYSVTMPNYGRHKFQGLFEEFLYQRDVEVTPFPPVHCPDGHLQARGTVISQLRKDKTFLFCAECGQKVDLPNIEKQLPDYNGDGDWIKQEEALARLRSTYEKHLTNVKGFRRDRAAPRCYISHLPAQKDWVTQLTGDLRNAGIHVITDRDDITDNDLIFMVSTQTYRQHFRRKTEPIAADAVLIHNRLANGKRSTILDLFIESKRKQPDPSFIQPGDFRNESYYVVGLFDLVLKLYAIDYQHPAFTPLRKDLFQQWVNMPKDSDSDTDVEAVLEQEAQTEDEKEGGTHVSEQYVDFDLHIAPNGYAVANSIEGQASAEIATEAPKNISLSLKLIEKRATDADLLKEVGQTFYNWLFPGSIHTHFQQTEAVARRENKKMRLRLRVETEEIASLPLEFLYRQTGGYFVAINPNSVLSRYLNLPMPPGFVRRREGPLHMLVIIADPSDQTHLPPGEWEAIIQEALADPLASGEMTLQIVKRATRKEIRSALLKQKPDIIQFVGHGIYENGKGYLALVDEKTDKTWLVDDETFANLYMGYDDHLGLISLATCESAKSDDPQGFLGIAPKLVQRGVPAVLSMQYTVYVRTAKTFFEDFYNAIANRKPVDWATQSARNAVSQEWGLDNREFATPVLYMRAEDGNVF